MRKDFAFSARRKSDICRYMLDCCTVCSLSLALKLQSSLSLLFHFPVSLACFYFRCLAKIGQRRHERIRKKQPSCHSQKTTDYNRTFHVTENITQSTAMNAKVCLAAASSFAAQISALECVFEMRMITTLGD